jgi:hypothetical protein
MFPAAGGTFRMKATDHDRIRKGCKAKRWGHRIEALLKLFLAEL